MGGINVDYKISDTDMGTAYYWGPIVWARGYEPWNGRVTSKGNRYSNLSISDNFPLNCCKDRVMPPAIPCSSGREITVSAAMNQNYWDHYMIPQGYTRISSPSTGNNCHGYATGTAYPNDGAEGIGVILTDDWEGATIDDHCCPKQNGLVEELAMNTSVLDRF